MWEEKNSSLTYLADTGQILFSCTYITIVNNIQRGPVLLGETSPSLREETDCSKFKKVSLKTQ